MRLDGYMTLSNMRANGVRSLFAYCTACHHEAAVNLDGYAGDLAAPSFAPRMRCQQCGKLGADVRPNCDQHHKKFTTKKIPKGVPSLVFRFRPLPIVVARSHEAHMVHQRAHPK
jgi:hypothetical protein